MAVKGHHITNLLERLLKPKKVAVGATVRAGNGPPAHTAMLGDTIELITK